MESNYTKIYSGNAIIGKRIELELIDNGITPIFKDEGESARLAGFASSMLGNVELHVNQDEKDKALEVVAQITAQK
jgi:hypothetical protein